MIWFKSSNNLLHIKDQNGSFHIIPNTKFNARHLSFMVTYTKSGINQTGFRFGFCGERGGGVMTMEKTVVRLVGFVLP